MNNPLYIPCSSLLEDDLTSLISLALSNDRDRVDKHGARKVALKYLLTMKSIQLDLSKWITEEQWRLFEEQYQSLRYVDPYKASFHEKRDQTFEPYWELSMDSKSIHPLATNARRFHLRDRPFNNEKLKIYFNHKQLENIPYSMGSLATTGFLDNDCRENLRKHPIIQRKNTGQIETKLGRIEKIVFELPPEEHVIILDFADERMPGGSVSMFERCFLFSSLLVQVFFSKAPTHKRKRSVTIRKPIELCSISNINDSKEDFLFPNSAVFT